MVLTRLYAITGMLCRILLVVLAILIGLYPAFYFIRDKFGFLGSKSQTLWSSITWSTAFYIHIIAGGLALLIGWIQFSRKVRQQRLQMHRNMGKLYVLLVWCSSVAGIYLGFYADGGIVAALGFICLGFVWFISTSIGYASIRKGQVIRHRQMMLYSYAACLAAVTLRLWLPALIPVFNDFTEAYRTVAWLSWVPNILVAYFLGRRMKKQAA